MDEKNILEKFSIWTKGLDPERARIAVFENIRDIPYAIVPELRDPYRGPVGILELNKGSCQPKHYLIAKLFGRLGIPAKYITYPFKWDEQELKYPKELKDIVKELPPAYHLACKAYINNKWILVDATWDLPLSKAGFPVNEKWDGSSDMINAVTPLEEVMHDTAEERVRYETERRGKQTDAERAAYAEFTEKFNAWCGRIRRVN